MASRKKEFMRDRAFSVPTTSTINDNQLNETSQQASHPKKKRKSETMVLRENQENMRTNSYYDDDQFGIVTRSRRRRFTTDTCLAFDKKKLTKNNKKNSKKTPLKSKAIAKKSPEEKKPKKKQLQENAGENEFDSLLANLRNGVENMSASTSTSIKEKLYEISTFPACGNFIKINNGITYCKLARNAGIGYMKPESIRPWVSLKAREFAVSRSIFFACI